MNRTSLGGRSFLWAGTLLALATACGCDIPLHRATETLAEVYPTSAAPRIVVETFNGAIDISNGHADEVAVEVTKHASGMDQQSAEMNLEYVEVDMTAQNDEVRVRIKRARGASGNSGAAVVIAAPPGSVVELKTSNGAIVCEGLRSAINARTSNGKIDVVEASGKIDVETSNGPILVEARDAAVQADTSNAGILFRGTLAEGEHTLSSSNGPIRVELAPESQFKFVAETSNAGVQCDFDYRDTGSQGRRNKAGVVGQAPLFSLDLETSNSSIKIGKERRRAD